MMKKRLSLIFTIVLALASSDLFGQNGKILVVSGGGARGAWGAGVAAGLHDKDPIRYTYKAAYATSTGSLMAPIILSEKYAELKNFYTTTTNKDILSKKIFKVKSDGEIKLRLFPMIIGSLPGRRSIAKSGRLRKLITEAYVKADHDFLLKEGRNLNVSVTSLNALQTVFKSNEKVQDYDEMVDWIWASANQPYFMSVLDRESPHFTGSGDQPTERMQSWVDGGVMDNVPITKAIRNAMPGDTIVVIVNNRLPAIAYDKIKGLNENNLSETLLGLLDLRDHPVEYPETFKETRKLKWSINILLQTIDTFGKEILLNDLLVPLLDSKSEGLFFEFYFMSRDAYNINPSSLAFDPVKMGQQYDLGFTAAKEHSKIFDEQAGGISFCFKKNTIDLIVQMTQNYNSSKINFRTGEPSALDQLISRFLLDYDKLTSEGITNSTTSSQR